MATRHKTFISYYHKDDQQYKDYLEKIGDVYDIFDNYSVEEDEVDDTNKTDEQIRCIIRDEYIRESTVTIVLIGQNTRGRKHVDWEIHASMFNTEKNPKSGLLLINLPTISQFVRGNSDEEKQIIAPYSNNWTTLTTRKEYEENYPYMSARIIDNFVKGVPITVANWTEASNSNNLKKLIDYAFNRRKTNEYDHSRELMRKNTLPKTLGWY